MSKKYQVLAGILGFFILSFASSAVYFLYNSPTTADEPVISRNVSTLSLVPDDSNLDVGESVSVKIRLSNAPQTTQARFRLKFSGGIKVDKFVPSLALSDRPDVILDNENGTVTFSGNVSASESSFSLGSLMFIAVSSGTVNLDFDRDFNPPSALIFNETRLLALQGATVIIK